METGSTAFKTGTDEIEDQTYQDEAEESCTSSTQSLNFSSRSTPPVSNQIDDQPPKNLNPWAKLPTVKTEQGQPSSFISIMAQQEMDTMDDHSYSRQKNSVRFEEQTTNIPDEEEMIRLAIEASLNDTSSTPQNDFATDVKNDEMDEDLRLALKLSMAEVNNSAKVESDDSDSKMPYAEYILSQKQASHHNNKDVKSQGEEEFKGVYIESPSITADSMPSTTLAAASSVGPSALTDEEQEAISRAIMEADDKAQAESLKLAMELQAEENREYERMKINEVRNNYAKSNVRTVTRSEFEGLGLKNNMAPSGRKLWSQADYEDHDEQYRHEIRYEEYVNGNNAEEASSSGYQMNSATPSKEWSRLDRNTILGPNNELRTKHDVGLKNQSNADRLLGGTKSNAAMKGGKLSVSDRAFNSFNQSLKNTMKRKMVKGVERSGTGRAENMNEKTRGGAMDGNVRLLISKAINSGLIQYCNGIVKEGKEAVVYHAEAGTQSEGFDVAIKVFKRIQEFRNRNMYIDDDPRYHGRKFRNADKREQVELWTEKEYRNLVRAQRAGIAVPTPLMQKENVLFMRFLGDGGWPASQLRELELKQRSKKWTILYVQTIVAIRKLYHCARLVHGDLSEFNILVCPMSQVENAMDKSDEAKDDLQIVLIDFGQAVERKHPSASELLLRDLSNVNNFFTNQEIVTLSNLECIEFVVEERARGDEEDISDGGTELSITEDEFKDDDASQDGNTWRHRIKGWSDEKDLERFESLVCTKKNKI